VRATAFRSVTNMPILLNPSAAAEPPNPIPKVRTWFWRSFPRISDDIQRGFEEHGDLIQLKGFGVRVYCLRNPEHIECVFKDPKVGISKLPSVFPRLKALMPKSIVVNHGDENWSKRRKQIQTLFKKSYMERYARITTQSVQEMLHDRWTSFSESGQTFDLYDELQRFLTQLGFRLFFSTTLSEAQLQAAQEKWYFIESQFPQRFAPYFPTRNDRMVRRYSGDARKLMQGLINARRIRPTVDDDLLSFLLTQHDPSTDRPYSDESMVDQMIELFTSVRLVGPPLGLGLRLIADHVEVQERLVDEASKITRNESPSLEHFPQLRYHELTISEVFRLYPSALALPRWCQDGMAIDRYRIPPKSVVAPMIFHTHRNPRVFSNPEEFRPSRWSPDSGQVIPHYAQLGFGAGKRTCLGVHLALMIMRITMASVFQSFRVIPQFRSQWQPGEVELEIHPSRQICVSLQPTESRARKLATQNASVVSA
jgi:cytochrome P450